MMQQPQTEKINENPSSLPPAEPKIAEKSALSIPVSMPLLGDLDLRSTELLLESAQASFAQRNFKGAAQILERALPSIDRLYSENEAAKMKALRMLRDCYLALSKGVEAQDCTEVALAVFEEIMDKKLNGQSSIGIGDPSTFARPVVRKLRTLRRAKESEYLRRRAVDISERWTTFIKLP